MGFRIRNGSWTSVYYSSARAAFSLWSDSTNTSTSTGTDAGTGTSTSTSANITYLLVASRRCVLRVGAFFRLAKYVPISGAAI